MWHPERGMLRTAAMAWALLAMLGLTACSEQPWLFTNGVGMPDGPPDAILAQAFEGGECGFACQPPGELAYCAKLRGEEQGPAPELTRGERYCFVGVATNASGTPTGIGCTVATAGTDAPIEVVFSPVDGINRATECRPDPPTLMDSGPAPDAGPTDAGAMDAGPPVPDAGPGLDAGPPPPDAGPPPTDAGPVEVELTVVGNSGRVLLVSETGNGWNFLTGVVPFVVGTIAGRQYTITANPDAGSEFVRFEGGGCGTANPCVLTVLSSTTVQVVFGPAS